MSLSPVGGYQHFGGTYFEMLVTTYKTTYIIAQETPIKSFTIAETSNQTQTKFYAYISLFQKPNYCIFHMVFKNTTEVISSSKV
jgi:hypothetical protein